MNLNTKIIWLSGLSGTGKTTLSDILKKKLSSKKTLLVDGDKFRKKRKKNKFNRKEITKNNYEIIKFVKKNLKKYNYIIVSVISPLKITRKYSKKIFKNNYYEIYLYCSKTKLFQRDPKGLYLKAKKGIIKNLIGYNSEIKYEKTNYKKLKLNTGLMSKKKCLDRIIKYIQL